MLSYYTTKINSWSKGMKMNDSNASQVIQSDSSNFWEALIAPEIGLFHGICLFYPRNYESFAAFCLSGQPILCEWNCYLVRMKWPTPVHVFKKSLKNVFFIFTEEVACKHFISTNVSKFRVFSLKWKSF